MPTPRVIDLSHHNVIPKDLISTREAGIIAVIHKMTEGISFTDPDVDARHYLARQADMAWGLYHFLRPGDMEAQAVFFLDEAHRLNVFDDDTLLAADHEDPGVSFDNLTEFLEEVERLSGRSPVIYSGHVLKEQCTKYPNKYRLWLAQYSSAAELPAGCEKYWLWQYTDQGTIAGVTPPTDLNHFEGEVRDFLDSWSGVAAPEPEDEPIVWVNIESPKGVRVEVTINGKRAAPV